MTRTPPFDEVLPLFCDFLIKEEISPEAGIFIRDGFGHVAFYSNRRFSVRKSSGLNRRLQRVLGGTYFPTGSLRDVDSAGAQVLRDSDPMSQTFWLENRPITIRLFDRRFFGRDWLITPARTKADATPLLTFGSLKGGVGRSTALFVLSTQLAREGHNILLIDLDLEAPGLGSLVFGKDERPRFGVLDYLVDNALDPIPTERLHEYVATSRLSDYKNAGGRVDLAPATGESSLENPQNVLAKLARGLVEVPRANEQPLSLSGKIKEMVGRLASNSDYDLILVDARAGLAELTAGPLLGLGGISLLFGTDHPHTFEGYSYLMAHLASLPSTNADDDWRGRIRFVHAQAEESIDALQSFEDKTYDLLAATFYEEDLNDDVFNFSLDDPLAPHKAWHIFADSRFRSAKMFTRRSVWSEELYSPSFGSFIKSAKEAIGFDV